MAKRVRKHLKVVSANMMSLPRHDRTVDDVIKKSTGRFVEIVGWQECDNEVYRGHLRRMKGYRTVFGGTTVGYNAPISFRDDDWKLRNRGHLKIYDGVKGISHTRHLEWIVLQSPRYSNLEVAVVNLHAPVVKKDRRPQRLEMRRKTKKRLKKVVNRLKADGYPVVITGDLNDKSSWFPVRILSRPVRVSYTLKNRIDQITLVNGRNFKWRIKRKTTRKTSSDHDTLVAHVIMIEKRISFRGKNKH